MKRKIQHRRKVVHLVLTLLGLLVLAACSNVRVESSVTSPSSASTSEAPIDSAALSSEMDPDSPLVLAYHPASDELLMASNLGLWRWNAARGWRAVKVPEAAAGLSGVVVNPEQPATLYASGRGLGVIRSNDGGDSWQAVNTGLPDREVTALALHSFQRETVYAWVRNDGIYRTENGGAGWQRVPDQGPADADVRGLTHSTLPGSMKTGWLYAATPSGAYLSMDCF